MAKKKGVKKKRVSPKAVTDKKVQKSVKKSTASLIYSLIAFLLSAIIFAATGDQTIEAFFGLVMVVSGALVLLFLILEIIFYVASRK